MRHPWTCLALVFFLAGTASGGEPGGKEPLRFGMAETMTVDLDVATKDTMESRFGSVLSEFTGVTGTLKIGGGYVDLAARLDDNKLHLAVFQGVELAWVADKYRDFKPLFIAVNQNANPQACLYVRAKSDVKEFKDLRGLQLTVPKKSKEHCRLFLERLCADAGVAPKEFFKEIRRTGGAEDAFDDLASGATQAVLADKAAADFYESLKPGVFSQLRLLAASEKFPASAIVYKAGALDDKLLERIRAGMLKANKSERGRDAMADFNLTSFDPVPADYAKTLQAIAKAYPAPK